MQIISEDELWEMSNIRPDDNTGLPMIVWISSSNSKEKHYIRIKVSIKYGNKINIEDGFFTITIPDLEVKGDTGDIKNSDIKLVKNWIKINQKILIEFWYGDLNLKKFFDEMIAI